MIRFKLSREHLGEIITATDGREAIRQIEEDTFDLIISDIHMPFHSGLEVVIHLREVLKKRTPVILLSAEGLEETVLDAFQLGANDFITKPFSPSELVIRIKKMLQYEKNERTHEISLS